MLKDKIIHFFYSSLNLFSSSLLLGLFSFSGPEKLNPAFEGIITYSVTNPSATIAQDTMMAGSKLVIYIKGDMIKTVRSSAMNKSIMITNIKKPQDFIQLQEIMGSKFLEKRTDEDQAEINKALDKKIVEQSKITYINGTREIAGYICYKALVALIKKYDTIISTVYYTNELPARRDISGLDYYNLKGLPLEYEERLTPTIKWRYTATSVVKQSLPDSTFTPSKDYIPATHEEIMLKIREYKTGVKPDDDMKN
jgi:hypothetical protein